MAIIPEKSEEQRLRDIREMAVVIDTWNDIFSDFDPSPLSIRTVSNDFVEELHKRYTETKTGTLVIKFYAPHNLESKESERMVQQRLKKHFNYLALVAKRELFRIRWRGILFIIVGVVALSFLTLATYFSLFSEIAIEIIAIILMPLGWFGIWEGFSKLVDTSPTPKRNFAFYNKLAKATYKFHYVEGE